MPPRPLPPSTVPGSAGLVDGVLSGPVEPKTHELRVRPRDACACPPALWPSTRTRRERAVSSADAFVDDARHQPHSPAADLVRDLARQGLFSRHAATVSGAEHTMLSGGAYDIVWPVVFNRLTRPVEHRRGHHRCAASVHDLEPECLDRFQDDVEAMLDDLFRNAKVPIHNLEGWIASRLNAATVNAYRRRRGERGALQRPRLPRWLAEGLGHDPWLAALAVEMLVWVGVPTAAGNETWPWSAWAERRSVVTGGRGGTAADLVKEVDAVLAAMRQSRAWYESFVERPLGRKQAPLFPANGNDPNLGREQPHLALTPRHESDDARLAELAALAVKAIEARLRQGEDPRSAVEAVLRTVFGSETGVEHMDRVPGADPAEDERVAALLADPQSLDRLVSAVLNIVNSQ